MTQYDKADIAAAYQADASAAQSPAVRIKFPDWAMMPGQGWSAPLSPVQHERKQKRMGRILVTVEVLKGDEWVGFATGPIEAARQHIEAGSPGVWRAVTAEGHVIIEPRPMPVRKNTDMQP